MASFELSVFEVATNEETVLGIIDLESVANRAAEENCEKLVAWLSERGVEGAAFHPNNPGEYLVTVPDEGVVFHVVYEEAEDDGEEAA